MHSFLQASLFLSFRHYIKGGGMAFCLQEAGAACSKASGAVSGVESKAFS
jgi:hypothetical protein